MEMNIKKALKEIGKEADVTHTDLSSAKGENADYYVGAADIVCHLEDGKRKIVSILNMMSIAEIRSKLEPLL